MKSISRFSVYRPITTLMIIIAVVVLGFISVTRLPLVLLPEISGHFLRIYIPYRSSSPQEVERLITLPVEDAMGTVQYLDSLRSSSSGNGASLFLEFERGTDMDLAAMEVRDRLDRVKAELPDDIGQIRIFRWQSTDRPIMEFSVAWPGDKAELFDIVERTFQRRIQRIDGVADVSINGMEEKQLLVDLDHNLMKAHRVDAYQLRQALNSNNINASTGTLIEGEKKYNIRVLGEFQRVKDIAKLPLKDGKIYLDDIAKVTYDFPERHYYQRLNGYDALTVRIMKSSTANIVDVARRVRKEIEEIRSEPGMGTISVEIFRDESKEIVKSLENLSNAGIIGGIFVVLVLLFFLGSSRSWIMFALSILAYTLIVLAGAFIAYHFFDVDKAHIISFLSPSEGWLVPIMILVLVTSLVLDRSIRSCAIISAAIPVSALFVFAFMFIARKVFSSKITLNMVSLMGLILAVGMLVDPAVVILENIFRYRQEGEKDSKKAAIIGSSEVGMAVMASTFTTMCVFVPLIFFSKSMLAMWMHDFGVVICLALIASLLVAVTLIPLVASRILTGEEKEKSRLITSLTNLYGKVVALSLKYRWTSIVITILVLLFSFHLYGNIQKERQRWVPARMVPLNVRFPRYYSIEDAKKVVAQVEEILLDSSLLSMKDIVDWQGFILKIREQSESTQPTPVKRIWELLNANLRQKLISIPITQIAESESRSQIINELNAIMGRRDLYRKENWQGVDIGEKARDLIKRGIPNLTDKEVIKLNRLLLESAFPDEVAKSMSINRKNELEIRAISSNFDKRRGFIMVFLTDEDQSKKTTEAIQEEIKELIPVIPGVKIGRGGLWGRGGGDQMSVNVEVRGKDMRTLERIADEVKQRLEKIPLVKDTDTSLESGNEEIRVVVDRTKAQQYGLTPMRVAQGVSSALSSRTTSHFKTSDKEIDINVQLREEDRVNLSQLKNMEFQNKNSEGVIFGALASFKRKKGPRSIERQDRTSSVTVMANTTRQGMFLLQMQLGNYLRDVKLPPGYTLQQSKSWYMRFREEKESKWGMILAAILIYMIMAALFESLVHPLTIMISVPFGFVGVAILFYITNTTIDHLTWVGLMLLCGLVVNNAIVLIDYINRLRNGGMDRYEAIIKGGKDRLRPILMTSLTTMLGLLPMVMPALIPAMNKFVDEKLTGVIAAATGPLTDTDTALSISSYLGSHIGEGYHYLLGLGEKYFPAVFASLEGHDRRWAPVSLALLGGLTTAAFLTLVIMPTIYTIVDDIAKWVKKVAHAGRLASPSPNSYAARTSSIKQPMIPHK